MARAKAAPKAGGRRKPKAKAAADAVRVRMYRQGLGDCFLLTFPADGRREVHVLIDCGVILGTPDGNELMKAVVADIGKTTGKRIDVLVATHEHWDHISGFDPNADLFKGFTFGETWLAWTENPRDGEARRLKREKAQKLAALWVGVGQLRGLAATDEARAAVDRAAGVLAFFGIDPAEAPPGGGLGAAAAAAGEGRTAQAMKWVCAADRNPRFFKPGEVAELPGVPGVRVYVLGPPRGAQLLKDKPTKKGRETYEEEDAHGLAAVRAFFAGAFGEADDPELKGEFDRTRPFDEKYRVAEGEARTVDFYRDHYYGSGGQDAEDWRRIDGEWAAGAAEFALQLDSDTNNTSLALAFELPDGRVLLFPGDAQVGNWESWHADADGKPQAWPDRAAAGAPEGPPEDEAAGRTVSAAQLLARTVVYKVGHHGSHNATLREKGLELMTHPDLIALVPVDVYVAHEKKHWEKMPFHPLMTRLAEKCKGRVILADTPVAKGARFPGRVADATGKPLEIKQDKKKPQERPLYVDYFVPAAE
jgi:hypothetical protein